MGTHERWKRVAEAVLACTGHGTDGLRNCQGLAEALDAMQCGIVLHRPGQMVPLFYNATVARWTGVAHGEFGPETIAMLMPRLTPSALAAMQAHGMTFGTGVGQALRFQCSLMDADGAERMFYGVSDRLRPHADAPVLSVFYDVEVLVETTEGDQKALAALTPEQIQAYGTLTQREREVLTLLAANLRSEEIAQRLFIAPQTVQTHRKNLKRKLGVRSVFGLSPFVALLGA